MDYSWRFEFWYFFLRRSPRDEGRVEALVLRTPGGGTGAREIVQEAEFSPELGMHGDRWSSEEKRRPGNQVSLVNIHVISSFAKDAESRAECGDNLHVDLELAEKNLPVGTRLEVGDVLLEITPEPHRPCKKFARRYGETAVKKVFRSDKKGRRTRGVLCQVLRAGRVRTGDSIRVLRGSESAL